MSQHTPGPWRAIPPERGYGEKRHFIMARDPDTYEYDVQVAQILWGNSVANADLIATAPELLLACKGALVALKLGDKVDKEHAITYLQEVIAKAEGIPF